MKARIRCECGAELPRPLPISCPECGSMITAVRRNLLSYVWPILVIGGGFAVLFFYLRWLLG